MSTTATLRLTDEEKMILQNYAESKGKTFTQFIKEIGLEVYKKYLERKEKGTLKTYSHEEVKKELGL